MAEQPRIVVFPRGQLQPKDKERLTKAGIIAIEADDPSKVHELQPRVVSVLNSSVITGDAIVRCALAALTSSDTALTYGGRAFVQFLNAAVKADTALAKTTGSENPARPLVHPTPSLRQEPEADGEGAKETP